MQHTDLGKASQARNSHRPLMASGSIKQFRPSQELSEVHFESTELAVPQARLEEELRIYEWRIKTEFPIVRIYDCSFLDERKGRSHLSIKLEKFPLRLSQLTDLPLFKTLYLLKESIIGFERLFAKFGAFPVTPRMVGLNQQNKCKVWLNESLANNSHITMPIEESAFLRQVVRAIEPSSNKLKNTSHFFGQLTHCGTFCQALAMIEHYCKDNQISLSNSCRIMPKEIATSTSIHSPSVSSPSTHLSFNPNLTMSKAPRFTPADSSLRTTLTACSSQKLIDFKSACRTVLNEEEETDVGSKRSGKTGTDGNQSITFSGSSHGDRHRFEESHIFGKKKDHRNFIFKSEVDPEKMKVSQPQPEDRKWNSNYESMQIPQQETPLQKDFQSEIQDEEDEEVTRMKAHEVYSKNNWQKSIGSLMLGQGELKSSVHMGGEKRMTETCHIKLNLLDKVGRNIHESFVQNQNHNASDYQWHPSTSEF